MKVIAQTRTTQGTSASRRLRRAEKLPGIVYGGTAAPTAIELEHNPIFHALRKEKFHASVLTMELDGKEELVVLRSFQMHPYKPQVLHIDFQRVDADKPLHVKVPLHFHGQENSPAVKVSKGLVSHVMNDVVVSCLPRDLPEFIEVDLSELKGNQTVRASDLKLPTGVTVVTKGSEDPALVTVTVKGGVAEEGAEAAAQ